MFTEEAQIKEFDFAHAEGNIVPVYLDNHTDENGKVIPRLVDMDAEIAHLFFQGLDFIKKKDYSAAKVYLKEPTDYNFNQILNW